MRKASIIRESVKITNTRSIGIITRNTQNIILRQDNLC